MHFVRQHLPCPDQTNCGSSDGYSENEDGSGKCFSCGKFFGANGKFFGTDKDEIPMDTRARSDAKERGKEKVANATLQYVSVRGIREEVLEKFGCKAGVVDGDPVFLTFPHPNGRTLHKGLEDKSFWWGSGEKTSDISLFGQDKFTSGSSQIVTITEGYLDGLSVYQMQDQKYPFVSVTSATSAKKECADAYEYLNGFDKIYLCFDSDGPGQQAAKEVARLFDFNKVYVVKLTRKDPNEYLEARDTRGFQKEWWAAKRYLPEGILSSYSQFDKVLDDDILKPSIPYPFERIQGMTYGIRTGELVLVTAQEGIGKTEFFRSLEYDILKNTNENIGILHLEEGKARTLKGLAGMELKSPIHLPDFAIPKDEIKKTIRKVVKRDDRVHIYSHFGSDDPDVILSTIRFMAGSCNCKYIFLDHITMVVTGLAGEDERRALDYISTRLAMMVEELDFTMFLISHVNDDGQTRGSRNIGKVCDLRIDLNRDIKAEDEVKRNTTFLTVAKNRFAGKTGPAGALWFDANTYLLEERDDDLPF